MLLVDVVPGGYDFGDEVFVGLSVAERGEVGVGAEEAERFAVGQQSRAEVVDGFGVVAD